MNKDDSHLDNNESQPPSMGPRTGGGRIAMLNP